MNAFNQISQRCFMGMFCLVAGLVALFLPNIVFAATSNICITADILTQDSGEVINGETEDWWYSADDPTDHTGYPLRGVWIEPIRDNGSGPSLGYYITDPTTGCVNVSHSDPDPFKIIIYGIATDSAGNRVRIHNGGTDTSTYYPGTTAQYPITGVTLGAPATWTLKIAESDTKWTTFAIGTLTLYRFHDGLSNKTFSIGFETTSNCGSSAHYTDDSVNPITGSNDWVEQGNGYSLIKIARCSTSDNTQNKFVISHEMGHSIAIQYYDKNGHEPGINLDYSGSAPCSATLYDMESAEWNSVGFREGYAHWVAARVWNEPDPTGVFTWLGGDTYDLEYGPINGGNTYGGWITHVCLDDNLTLGLSTNYDWLRFFWDFDTQSSGCDPSKLDMQKIYKKVRENGTGNPNPPFPLYDGNYHSAVYYAITTSLASTFAGCTTTYYMDHACTGGLELDGDYCID